MNNLAKFVNDVYEGLYYYALKYESVEEAKNGLRLRIAVSFFLYYFSFLLLLMTVRIKLYGTMKIRPIEAVITIFGIYFLLYRYFIEASLVVSSFDDSIEERERKVRLSLLVFWGSICLFAVTFGLIYYLMPKK